VPRSTKRYDNCLLAAPDSFRLEAGMAFAEVVAPNSTERERDRVEEAVRSCRSRR
jgi:ferredoxin